MTCYKKNATNKKTLFLKLQKKIHLIKNQIKNLNGNPHYIAIGMATGVFVAATPTIPFHTALAITIATFVKGSRIAAAIGVWFSNPITIPIIYISSYKIGMLLLGTNKSLESGEFESIFRLSAKVAIATTLGGIILGIIPSLITYFIVKKTFLLIQKKLQKP